MTFTTINDISKATVYQTVRRDLECDHPSTELRQKVASNGVIAFWRQCLICGQKTERLRRDQLSASQRTGLADVDEALRQRWWDKVSVEYQRRAETQRQSEHDQWWAWYNEYLRSDEWRDRRQRVLVRDGFICKACERQPATQVHHLTYARVGREPLFDLISVCEPCHDLLTAQSRARRS